MDITLYCKEITPPEGYLASTDVVSLTFYKTDYDALKKADKDTKGELKVFAEIRNITPTPTVTQPVTITPPGDSGLYLQKKSSAADDIMALESYTLEGAEFSVTSNRGFSGTLVTDKNGMSNILSLPDNHTETWIPPVTDMEGNVIQKGYYRINDVTTVYTIKETKAPKWHKLSDSTPSISVTMPKDKDTVCPVIFDDEPIFCKDDLEIEKLGIKGEPVVGAVFKVEYFDGPDANDTPVRTWYLKTKEDGFARLTDEYLDPENQSDPFFMHKGKIVIPIGGFLQVTEIKAPAEYIVYDKPTGIPTTEDADFTLTFANGKAWYEDLEPCIINLQKYEPDGSTPIAGAEFELKFLKQAITPTSKVHPNFSRLLKEGESIVLHTDENGKVTFRNLDQGTYQITELRTEAGRNLLKEPIIVTLPMTMTSEEASEYGNVNFETAKEDEGYTNKWFFYECLYEITNNSTLIMPTTGGNGIWKYGIFGFGMMACAAVVWIGYDTKKKRRRKRYKK